MGVYIHGRGVVVLTFMGVGQVLLFVYKTCGEGEGGVECFYTIIKCCVLTYPPDIFLIF